MDYKYVQSYLKNLNGKIYCLKTNSRIITFANFAKYFAHFENKKNKNDKPRTILLNRRT